MARLLDHLAVFSVPPDFRRGHRTIVRAQSTDQWHPGTAVVIRQDRRVTHPHRDSAINLFVSFSFEMFVDSIFSFEF
jgi:hypothetical protein